MILYSVLFPVIVTFLFLFSNNDSQKKVGLFISGSFLSILVGFRGSDVGIDTETYYTLYDMIISGYDGTWVEKKLGYIFIKLSLLSNYIGGGAVFLTFIYSLFTIYLIFLTLYRESYNVALSVSLFFSGLGLFFFMHNVMRQALAVAIILYSVRFVYNKKTLEFLAFNFLAILVHASAVFFMPFYFLVRFFVPAGWLVVFWLFSMPFTLFDGVVIKVLMVFDFLIPEQYISYLYAGDLLELGGSTGLGFVLVFKQLLFIVFIFTYNNVDLIRDRVIILLSIYSIIIGNIVLGLGVLGRFNFYLSIFIILAVPVAINALIKPHQRNYAYICFVLLCYIIYFRGLIGDGSGIFPVT